MIIENTIKEMSSWYIRYRRALVYFQSAYILHAFTFFVLILFIKSLEFLAGAESWRLLFFAWFSTFLFTIAVTSQMDAYSRYQNYKMVKDMLHEYGFRTLILKPFSRSRCQRDAALHAAVQLGYNQEIQEYFYRCGYRWYHIIPSILIENPRVFFSKSYWITTFFVPKYKSKYFHW